MISLLFEELPFILLNYSKQIPLYTIIDFNFMALFFAYELFYNNIHNDKIRMVCSSLIKIVLLRRQTLAETLEMLKLALFDCAINENCSVD